MIYAVPTPNEPLSQADSLDACPIFGLETTLRVSPDGQAVLCPRDQLDSPNSDPNSLAEGET